MFNIFESASRWAVDGFVLISGALFLKKDIDIKRLYKHSILKLMVVYMIWSEASIRNYKIIQLSTIEKMAVEHSNFVNDWIGEK